MEEQHTWMQPIKDSDCGWVDLSWEFKFESEWTPINQSVAKELEIPGLVSPQLVVGAGWFQGETILRSFKAWSNEYPSLRRSQSEGGVTKGRLTPED